MKPTHYYLQAEHGTQTKNKLQAEFAGYLKNLNGKLIDASKLGQQKAEIIKKQNELNAKYPRCKLIDIVFYKPGDNEKWAISGFFGVCFYFKDAYYVPE